MSNHAEYFATYSNAGKRLTGLHSAALALPCRHASRARYGFAPACGFASVFLPVAGRHRTASDNLPQLPQLALKKLGQRKPNKHAMPQLPQVAPTVFKMNRNGNEAARRVVCGQRIKFAPQNRVYATQPCNFQKVLPGIPCCG